MSGLTYRQNASSEAIPRLQKLEVDTGFLQQSRRKESRKPSPDNGNSRSPCCHPPTLPCARGLDNRRSHQSRNNRPGAFDATRRLLKSSSGQFITSSSEQITRWTSSVGRRSAHMLIVVITDIQRLGRRTECALELLDDLQHGFTGAREKDTPHGRYILMSSGGTSETHEHTTERGPMC